jgi:ACS family hexuronate transporter-like MFS transporter
MNQPRSSLYPLINVHRSHFRWVVCLLLFLATTINYMDRQILGILAKQLQTEIGWSELQYSYIVMAFQTAYAIGLLSFGWFIDRWGTKKGYSLAILIWSVAAAFHATARTVFGFGVARFCLGLGESGNFPAAIKCVTEWFPRRERALATGLFNSGSNIGAIIAPVIVPWIALNWGWRPAFVILGGTGLLWIVLWLLLYERPERSKWASQAERDYILSDEKPTAASSAIPPHAAEMVALAEAESGAAAAAEQAGAAVEPITAGVSWKRLLGFRQTWAYIVPSAVVSPIWWFYLYWLPKFLGTRYGLDLSHIGRPLVIVYSMAMAGSIGGGWLSSTFLRRGWSVNAARKVAMLICVSAVAPVAFITAVNNIWIATLLAGLATLGHQGLSANLYTMVSDLFPKRAVASVVGLGSAVGSATAIGFSLAVGLVLQYTGSYAIPFVTAGVGYPLVLLCLQLMEPRWEPAQL